MMLFNKLSEIKKVFETVNYKQDAEINSFQFDSRNITNGDVFIALKAERNGHEFLQAAKNNGAIAAIVEDINTEIDLVQFKTENSWQALELLAEQARTEFKGKVIAITGSCGKTTNKQMLSHSLANSYCTPGSFNGLLGLPLTLTQINQSADYAVIEMGTDEPGNINKLTNLTKPDIAIVTSIGPAHLEMFKSIDNIIKEKLSIANSLTENGCFIIPHNLKNRVDIKQQVFTFAIDDKQAYAHIINVAKNQVTASVNGKNITFNLTDTASHKLSNALISLITLEQLGFSLEQAAKSIESFTPPAGRGEQINLANNNTLIDESYNANPLSMAKALESFNNIATKTKVVILGNMLELGPDEIIMHKQLAQNLNNINTIFTVGNLMQHLHDELTNKSTTAKHFATADALVEYLKTQEFNNCDIFVKGSNGSKVSKAVEYFKTQI